MKKIILTLISIVIFSCTNDAEPTMTNETNKVVLLKVDLLTNEFEGGKKFEFSESDSFTITYDYHPPGDFGGVSLFYSELNEKIFEGTIIWLGSGHRSYPEELDQQENFTTISETLEMPESDMFETIFLEDYTFFYFFDTVDYEGIWNAIANLEVVKSYRDSNPQGKINLFLYTPSVGIGNPAEWDWYIYIKN